jgi:hypothetical protein
MANPAREHHDSLVIDPIRLPGRRAPAKTDGLTKPRCCLHNRLGKTLPGDRLVLQRPEAAVAELRALGASLPTDRSLVDELLAERRAAAAAAE